MAEDRIIIDRDEAADGLYLVLDAAFFDTGTQQRTQAWKAIGEDSLLYGTVAKHAIISAKQSLFLRLPRARYLQVVKKNPEAIKYLRRMREDFSKS